MNRLGKWVFDGVFWAWGWYCGVYHVIVLGGRDHDSLMGDGLGMFSGVGVCFAGGKEAKKGGGVGHTWGRFGMGHITSNEIER